MGMSFSRLVLFAKTEGEHTFTIFEGSGSERVMKLSGASRTYSHTAEPRNVNIAKFANGVKDWPISTSKTTIFDDSVICPPSEFNEVIIEISPYDTEKFSDWIVVVDGETLTYTDRNYFENKEQTIRVFLTGQPHGVGIWYFKSGTYQVNIASITQNVAEDFKEAVEAVSGGGGGSLPDPSPKNGQIIYSNNRTWQAGIPNSDNANSGFMAPYFSLTDFGVEFSNWRNVPAAPIYTSNFVGTAIPIYDHTMTPEFRGVSLPSNMFVSNTLYLLLKNNSGQFVLKELLMPTGTDSQGTYVLKCTKSSDSAEGVLQWVKES